MQLAVAHLHNPPDALANRVIDGETADELSPPSSPIQAFEPDRRPIEEIIDEMREDRI